MLAIELKSNEWILMKFLRGVKSCTRNKPLYLEDICRILTSPNAQGYNNSHNILRITDHIFIKTLPEMALGPWQSPSHFWGSSVQLGLPPVNDVTD